MEMRYLGQSWKLRVLPPPDLSSQSREELKRRFDEVHRKAYGYDAPADEAEIVNIGVTAIGALSRPRLEHVVPASEKRPVSTRDVYFREAEGYVRCAVLSRYQVSENEGIEGPAVIEEKDSTTIVYPGYRASSGLHGVLLISAMEA
jgi:N-methylhydantoinase A